MFDLEFDILGYGQEAATLSEMRSFSVSNATKAETRLAGTFRVVNFEICNARIRVYAGINDTAALCLLGEEEERRETVIIPGDYSISELARVLSSDLGMCFSYEGGCLSVESSLPVKLELQASTSLFWMLCNERVLSIMQPLASGALSVVVLGPVAAVYSASHPKHAREESFMAQLRRWNDLLPSMTNEICGVADLIFEAANRSRFMARVLLGAPGLAGRRLIAMDRKIGRGQNGVFRLKSDGAYLGAEFDARVTLHRRT